MGQFVVVDGNIYDEHFSKPFWERSYIVVIANGKIVSLPGKWTSFSKRNRSRKIRERITIEADELLLVGKSGVKGLEGEYGWGGSWFRARFKPGIKTYVCFVKTRRTYAEIRLENAELVELKLPPWERSSRRWASCREV